MKLSISMMVKNESKYLDQVLQSLLPIIEAIDTELIIVDTGSTDNTVEIAKKYTDKVYFHQWNNNFSEMRNITLSYATGDWILIIDGDEVLENPQGIIDFLRSNQHRKFNTGSLSIKNITNEEDETAVAVFLAPRLFKNRKDFKFKGAVHNQANHIPPYIEIKSTLIHYGYLSTDKELMEEKFQRTGSILKAELEKDPENIYYWYQLSVTYSMHLDHDLAVEPAERAYQLVKEKYKNHKPYVYVYLQLVKAYTNNRQYQKAEEICDEVLKFAKEYIDIHYLAGKLKAIATKYEDAIKHYKIYLELVDNYDNTAGKKDIAVTQSTLQKYEEVYRDLVTIYEKQEQYDLAMQYIKKIENKKEKLKLLKNIVNIYIKLQNIEELKEFYVDEILTEDNRIVEVFEMHLENIKSKITKDKIIKIEEAFSRVPSKYAVLNKAKLEEINEFLYINDELLDEISQLDFSNMPLFYGNILFYLLKRNYPLSNIISNIRISKLRTYLDYLIKVSPEYGEVVLEYLNTNPTEKIQDARINKELSRYALVLEKLEENDFKQVLNRYIQDGIFYITNLYHPTIIEEELLYEIKEEEEVFLMYLYKGRMIKEKNPAEYIRYLRKAINVFPFKKGIEILKEELEQELNPAETEEMKLLKKQFKDNIKILIENKKIEEAEELIRQYEEMIPQDVEMIFFKSQISLIRIEGKDHNEIIN